MTGLTQALKDDFRAMREIKSITDSDAQVKVKECQKLFHSFQTNKYCKQKMEDFDFEFVQKPIKMKATKYDAGNYIMGMNDRGGASGNERIKFDIESNGRDLDRKIQCKMYD